VIAKRAKGLSGFFYSCVDVVMVRKVALKERVEEDEGLSKADRAPAVEHQVRGVAMRGSKQHRNTLLDAELTILFLALFLFSTRFYYQLSSDVTVIASSAQRIAYSKTVALDSQYAF
jgi:hypothetical protein